MRNSSITQLIIGAAVAVGMSVIAVSAVAQSTAEPSQSVAQESLTNRFSSQISEADWRLSDRQQLKGYFLDTSRDRFR
jgi:opacity protein-like surface antigen